MKSIFFLVLASLITVNVYAGKDHGYRAPKAYSACSVETISHVNVSKKIVVVCDKTSVISEDEVRNAEEEKAVIAKVTEDLESQGLRANDKETAVEQVVVETVKFRRE